MEQPIINPPNPYVGTLRIFPGTLVKVAGRPRPNATRFAINFQTGPSLNPRDDLALHLSPCFTPPRIVRNSLQNGTWGLEEAWTNGATLDSHASFEIMILAENDQFKIAINGSHFCEFRHRIPFHYITHLTIDGDVDIERISISSGPASAPPPAPSYQTPVGPPYPAQPTMPMPPLYPNLAPNQAPPSHYPAMPSGPMPTPAAYASGFPQPGPYPPQAPQNPYPQTGPLPTGGYYQGYPQPGQQQPQNQPQPSGSSLFGNLPFGNKALGTVAGLAAGAAVLSAVSNPLKTVKKIVKPHKAFKHKGWGKSSSSSNSSISSRGSFSSNSS